MKKPTVLMIRDGWGYTPNARLSAIERAATPNDDRLAAEYPTTLIHTFGEHVGLPPGYMGNSEVGHLNIGAGRVVYQDMMRITKAVEDESFFANEELVGAVRHALDNGSSLHTWGLLSDAGVHSHMDHLRAVLRLAKKNGLERVYVHAFMDGRDTPPDSGVRYMAQLVEMCGEEGVGKVATVVGRYWAMDRDKRYDRNERAYRMLVAGEGDRYDDPVAAVRANYERKVTDEFIEPSVIVDADGRPTAVVGAGDAVIFFNFRGDRARQITRAFVDPDFDGFARAEFLDPYYVCLTEYDATIPARVAFKPGSMKNIMAEVLERQGLTNLRIAETEKYAHVTFFFNGGREEPYRGEERCLIPSPKVATYDLQPEMSARRVTDELLTRLDEGKYDVVILNYANCDMVGHTGDFEAAKKAVETVDECMGRVVDRVLALGGRLLITADHGNADEMLDENGTPYTAHTIGDVPLMLVDPALKGVELRSDGALCDIVPTMFRMMGIGQPAEMTGRALYR